MDPNAPDGGFSCLSNYKCKRQIKKSRRVDPKNERRKRKERDDGFDGGKSASESLRISSDIEDSEMESQKTSLTEVSYHHGPKY